jgi:Zn-dependent protease
MKKSKTSQYISILLGIIILGISISIYQLPILLPGIIISFIIISINISTKRYFANTRGLSLKTKIWEIQQYGWKSFEKFKTPKSLFFLPLLTSIITSTNLIWMGIFTNEFKPKKYRVGISKFKNPTELEISLILFSGVIANFLIGLILIFLGDYYSLNIIQLGKYSLYYAFWQLIPIGDLDGSKILAGNRKLWYYSILTILILILLISILI